jgi:hypothetical protein
MNGFDNLGRKYFRFIQLFTESETVSKADIMKDMNLKSSTFYKYLAECRKIFKIKYEGSIGGNAYYSINKESIYIFFNLN